jgi:DNA polymerase III epsilon subunit-like protein
MDMRPPASFDRPLAEHVFVAFDTESTGYSNYRDRLLEIAGVRLRWVEGAWRHEAEFAELIAPAVSIPAETIAIHGLTDDAVAGAAPPPEVLDRFFAFAGGAILLAHYAPADAGLIGFAYARAGRTAPLAWVLDTFYLPRKLFPGLPNYALETLATNLGLPAPAHRALPDARTTAALFERSVQKLGDPAVLTVTSLLAHAGAPCSIAEFAEIPLALPERLAAIEPAMAERRDLTIEYRGGSKGGVPRRVTPSHFFARQGHVFLEAWCHTDREMKSFRFDRIERASVIAESEPGRDAGMRRA